MAPLLYTFIFLVFDLVRLSNSAPSMELLTRSCRDKVVRNVTNYIVNYEKIVGSMVENMERDKFAMGEIGDPPERLYVLSQCTGDLSGKDCLACFHEIKEILMGCFPNTGGRIFFGGCYIRAENYPFFNLPVEPDDLRKCGDSVNTQPEFSDMVRKKINELVRSTAESGSGVAYKRTRHIFVLVMATCWKTMDRNMCNVCVEKAAQVCSSCLPSTEGRVLNSGCILRYADYDFGNNRALRAKDIMLIYATYVFVGLSISALIAAVGIYVSRTTYKRKIRRWKTHNKGMHMDFSVTKRGLNFLEFKFSTLEKATECFDEAHKLGQGGYGEVFRGKLADGREIAIKRLFATGKTQSEVICNEIDVISSAQHKNLVRFLGCCFTTTNSFLVYEFLVNKSLDRILFDSERKKELDWKKRLQIIVGTAEGLEYLHKGCQMRIIHRDIKASNILLGSRFKPKIADFGLARFSSCGRNLSGATIAGTFGYLAPEYLAQGRLTEKVDVYSFGVLVLEIVTGVRNNKLNPNAPFETLVAHAWKHFQSNTVLEIIEKSMEMEIKDIEEVKRVVQVGLLCTQESPSLRPSMTIALQMLKQNDIELPTPSKPPFIDEHLELSSSSDSCRCQPSCISDLCTRTPQNVLTLQ
ncbi:putative cysteine-rich receptor-like protein kinase 43 [Morus notabilis]|uniref:putative cysteine-rich receptor-like protein kinase 43 n=1 Tax=Morus notabilis TaxID=981085 RepID=UPI000CED3217|nr:putative cysteine-rich receptor-like protein kinase 43 [Morus notabilis]